MDVPIESSIIDDRKAKDFTTATFTGFKKMDVINQLSKSIENGKLEEACFWSVELHISGHINLIWNEIFNIMTKKINIENPKLPLWLWLKYKKFLQIIKGYTKTFEFEHRNNQEIRNLLVDVVAVIALSRKNEEFDKKNLPKIENKDFTEESIKRNMIARDLNLIVDEISNEDDSEIKIAINEIANHLRNDRSRVDHLIYWYIWLVKLEKFKQKNKIKLKSQKREIKHINTKYNGDWIWLLWRIILKETEYKNDKKIKIQVVSLYNIYKYRYTNIGKDKKQYAILFSFMLLKNRNNWNMPIIRFYHLRIQACGNINQLYKLKKQEQPKKGEEKEMYENIKNSVKPKIEIKTSNKKEKFKIDPKKREEEREEAKMFEKINHLNNLIVYKENHL